MLASYCQVELLQIAAAAVVHKVLACELKFLPMFQLLPHSRVCFAQTVLSVFFLLAIFTIRLRQFRQAEFRFHKIQS